MTDPVKVSTRTEDKPAEHGLTMYAARGMSWGSCVCGWKSADHLGPMGTQLRFGEHLLAVSGD